MKMRLTPKKTAAFILAVMLLILPVVSQAASENVPKEYEGNANYLIDIRNPESIISSTTGKVCVISAIALPDTTVTLYSLNNDTNTYEKMYANGKALEATVGASGLYAQSIELKPGLNNIMVMASANGEVIETVKLEITLLKSSVSDNVKSLWQSLLSY